MPFRYYELPVKFLLEKLHADEAASIQAYKHAAAEIERVSTDPSLDPVKQAVLQKAVQKLTEFGEQESAHQLEVVHVLRSLGIWPASKAPLVVEPIKPSH
jgi:hypothetical protein